MKLLDLLEELLDSMDEAKKPSKQLDVFKVNLTKILKNDRVAIKKLLGDYVLVPSHPLMKKVTTIIKDQGNGYNKLDVAFQAHKDVFVILPILKNKKKMFLKVQFDAKNKPNQISIQELSEPPK